MCSLYFQTTKDPLQKVPLAIGLGEVEEKKNQEVSIMTAKWAIGKDDKIDNMPSEMIKLSGNDTDTKSPDTGNKPEWYQRAEHELDQIYQGVAFILTTSW